LVAQPDHLQDVRIQIAEWSVVWLFARPNYMGERARHLSSVIFLQLGAAALGLRLLRVAAACFRHVLARDPNHIAALSYSAWISSELGQIEQSISLYQRLISLAPHSIDGYVGAANGLQRLGRHEPAIAYYREALNREPGNALVRYNLACSLAAVGESEEAASEYFHVVRTNPSDAQAAGNLAATLGQLGRWDEAVNWAGQALDHDPSPTHALNLGIALFELRRYAEAEGALSRGLALEPTSTEMRVRLALALAYQQKYARALEMIRNVATQDRNGPQAASSLVAVLTLKGDFDEAVHVATHFVERWPELPLAYETLGWAYLKRGDADKSLAAYNRATASDPGNPQLHACRGAALSLANRHREALEAFNKALQIAPDCLNDYPELAARLKESRATLDLR
jgi:tetratricopeptide (TPR) repeat protein